MIENIKNLLRTLTTMITWANKTNIGKDTGERPLNQYSSLGSPKDSVAFYPYGSSGNAPLGNLCLKINVGHEENSIVLELSGDNRIKGLKSGEYVIGNWVTKSNIFFSEDGKITITSNNDIDVNCDGDVNITATGDVNITAGKVTINGDLDVTGDVVGGSVATSGGVDLGTHVHFKEATPPVVDQTGPPV